VRARSWLLAAFAVVAALASPVRAFAAGYLLPGQGSRAMSLGGAFTAMADDASAVYWNPAGLARLKRAQVYGGISPSLTNLEFAGVAPYPGYEVLERWRENVLLPPHLFAAIPLRNGLVGGIGVYSPAWFESDWQRPESFAGRFLGTETDIRSVVVNPSIGFTAKPLLMVGAGASLVFSDVNLSRRLPVTTFDEGQPIVADLATARFDGDPSPDLSLNVGVMYGSGSDRVAFAYRHRVTTTIDGKASFTPAPNGSEIDTVLAPLVPAAQSGQTTFVAPATATLGGMIRLSEWWRVAIDLQWTAWSAVDRLVLRLDDDAWSTETRLDYHDAVSARAGLAFEASEKLELRVGYAFEDSPSPTNAVGPVLPDASRHLATFGFGYKREAWRLDLFEAFMIGQEREVRRAFDEFDGDYDQRGWTFGASVGYVAQ
jgi:long-chain fatty acid transport protein